MDAVPRCLLLLCLLSELAPPGQHHAYTAFLRLTLYVIQETEISSSSGSPDWLCGMMLCHPSPCSQPGSSSAPLPVERGSIFSVMLPSCNNRCPYAGKAVWWKLPVLRVRGGTLLQVLRMSDTCTTECIHGMYW